jgi:hypothetical protein
MEAIEGWMLVVAALGAVGFFATVVWMLAD